MHTYTCIHIQITYTYIYMYTYSDLNNIRSYYNRNSPIITFLIVNLVGIDSTSNN